MAGKGRVAQLGELHQQAAQRCAVGRKVVATENGEWGRVRGAAARQRLDQKSVCRLRVFRVGKIGRDAGMRSVEITGRIAQIGLLGDRQRDDADARIDEHLQERRLASRGDQEILDRSDDPQGLALAAALGKRI